MKDKFEFLIHILINTQEYESFKSIPAYLVYRDSKFVTKEVVVPSDYLFSPHKITPFPWFEAGEIHNSSADLPPSSPTPHTLNFSTCLDCEYDVCDDVLSPRPQSIGSFGPPDYELLCSPVSNVYFYVHEDQV